MDMNNEKTINEPGGEQVKTNRRTRSDTKALIKDRFSKFKKERKHKKKKARVKARERAEELQLQEELDRKERRRAKKKKKREKLRAERERLERERAEQVDAEMLENLPTLDSAQSDLALGEEQFINKVVHLCEVCCEPIKVYGRMIPCTHVFCIPCAIKHIRQCPKCKQGVLKIEEKGPGTMFMCTFGRDTCRRTYCLLRDLESHYNFRHVNGNNIYPTYNPTLPTTSYGATYGATYGSAYGSTYGATYGTTYNTTYDTTYDSTYATTTVAETQDTLYPSGVYHSYYNRFFNKGGEDGKEPSTPSYCVPPPYSSASSNWRFREQQWNYTSSTYNNN